jgi:hypothetical protein
MDSCKVTYIYGLYEIGKEDEIRYIGKSDCLKKRLRDHKYDKRITSYKSSWVKSVLSKGGDIGIKSIAVVDNRIWKEREMFYITEYSKNHKLVNLTTGGNGASLKYSKSYEFCKNWISENKPDWVKTHRLYNKWLNEINVDFLPMAPHRVFGEWCGWGDYLGSDIIAPGKRNYLDYEEAKLYIKNNYEIKIIKDYRSLDLPTFLSKRPQNIYKEWKGWEDYLGINLNRNIEYLTYEEAKEWIKNNYPSITVKQYRNMAKNNEFPIFISKKPERKYENFIWADYLYNNGRKKHREFYLKFEEAREIVRKLGLKSNMEWRRWCKNKPKELIRIPPAPDFIYDEWVSWYDWLGK